MTVLLFAIESPTIIILVVAAIFLLFGGSKLPQLAKALGQSKKAFKDGLDDAEREGRLARTRRGDREKVSRLTTGVQVKRLLLPCAKLRRGAPGGTVRI